MQRVHNEKVKNRLRAGGTRYWGLRLLSLRKLILRRVELLSPSAMSEMNAVLAPEPMNDERPTFAAHPDADRAIIHSGADALHEVAQTLTDQVGEERAALKQYGTMLTHTAQRLHDAPDTKSLIEAVAVLTAETARASERNRTLEQQLSASANRIARLRQSLLEVRQEAATDALTGIANRRAFSMRLKRAIGQARSDQGLPFSLLLLDVDHFKFFNDTYGHKAGDLVLRLLARLLTDNVKGRDTVARYGGEEFAVLLIGAECVAAASVARQITKALSGRRLVNKSSGQDVGHVTVSIGVAQFRQNDNCATLLERADTALYRAKRGGRNQVFIEAEPESLDA